MTNVASRTIFEHRIMEIYSILRAAADNDEPCPTNAQIAARLGWPAGSSVTNCLCALKERGVIRVAELAAGRRVTIVVTGQTTSPFIPENKPRNWPAGPPKSHDPNHHDSPEQIAKRAADRDAAAARLAALIPVDRSPCDRCGVRGDVGCKHRNRT